MSILNARYDLSDYSEWKKTFDKDPLDREGSGVRSYTIERHVADERTVITRLEFAGRDEAEAFADRLRELLRGPTGQKVSDTRLDITEVVEHKQLARESRRAA